MCPGCRPTVCTVRDVGLSCLRVEGPAPGGLYPAVLSNKCSMGLPAWLLLKPLEVVAPNSSHAEFNGSGLSPPTSPFSAS